MVMNLPGVREHHAFYAYHMARVLEVLSLLAAYTAWGLSDVSKRFIGGGLFLMWEAFEIAYLITRGGQAALGHENILGVFTIDNLAITVLVHAARGLIGLALIYAGRSRRR
jgi:hypothetical protein